MATNTYTYGSLGQRWTIGEPTSKALLDLSRTKADANRWTLQQLVTDPDNTANFALSAATGTFSGDLAVDSDTLFVDVSADKVSINAGTTPQSTLHIQNTGTNAYAIEVDASDGGNLWGVFEDSGGAGQSYLRDASGNPKVVLNSVGDSYFTGGQVGFGTASAEYPLDVDTAGGTSYVAHFRNTTNTSPYTVFIEEPASANSSYPLMYVGTASRPDFRIDSAGRRIGMGVSPSVDMHANNSLYLQLPNNVFRWSRSTGSYQSSNFTYNLSDAGVFAANGYGLLHSQNTSTGAYYWSITTQTNTSGAGATASLSTKMYLDSTGLGLGASSSTEVLDVAGAVKASAAANNWGYSASFFDRSGNDTRVVAGATSGNSSNIAFWTYNSGTQSQKAVITNDGKVGIGEASPTQKLTLSGGSSAVAMLFNSTDTAFYNIGIKKNGSQLRFIEYGNDGTTEGANIMVLDANGEKVGIGTTAPTGTLELSSSATDTNLVMGGTPSSGTREPWRMQAEGDYLYIGQNKSSFAKYMTFVGSSIGIGTTSPAYKLVVSNGGAAGYEFNVNGLNSGVNTVVYNRSSSAYVDSAHFALNYYVYTGSTPAERFRIESTGDCAFMTANKNIRFNGTATQSVLTNNDGVEIYTGGYIWAGRQAASLYLNRAGTTGDVAAFYYNSTTTVGSISVTSSATAYNTSSDHRLKENLAPIANAVDRVNALQPRRFNFINSPGVTVDGFVAHEVSDIVPEAITGTRDAVDDDGEPIYQGIDQSKLVPLLTAAIQELTARVDALEAA